MRQANWPFPNLLEETIDWNQMYCTRLIPEPGPSEENDREGGQVGNEGEGKEDGEDGYVLAAVVHRVHQHQLLRVPVGC